MLPRSKKEERASMALGGLASPCREVGMLRRRVRPGMYGVDPPGSREQGLGLQEATRQDKGGDV